MKYICFIYVCFITHLLTYAQQTEEDYVINPEKYKITEINFFSGIVLVNIEYATQNDFLKLAPQSKLLQQNLDGYSSSYIYLIRNINTAFTINLGINFPNKLNTNYNYNRTLRLGIHNYNYTSLSASYYKEIRMPYDTLTSGQSGQTIYIDSVYTHLVDIYYRNKNLRIDINYIFKRNPNKRFVFYAGIGCNIGFSYAANTFITDTKMRYTQSQGLMYVNFPTQQTDVTSEIIRNKNSYGFSVYIPAGLDFRIGNKNKFWRQFHLLYEIRPDIQFFNIPLYGSYINNSANIMFGIRACFD